MGILADSHVWGETPSRLPLRDVMWGDYTEFLGGVKELRGVRKTKKRNNTEDTESAEIAEQRDARAVPLRSLG